MSELLRQSIETLSSIVNVSTGIAHPLDDARAKELFKALHAHGEVLSRDQVETFALENHWSQRHAAQLADLAERIGNGGRVVIKNPRQWGEPTVARLKAEIEAGGV
jgi:hypothetical protein